MYVLGRCWRETCSWIAGIAVLCMLLPSLLSELMYSSVAAYQGCVPLRAVVSALVLSDARCCTW
jgi:hypothetical protein